MPQVVAVRFRFNSKPLWFDPQEKSYTAGAEVLVETERGREVGLVTDPAIEVTSKQISKLKSPLKPVIRELTDLDYEHIEALEEKGKNALPYFREKIEEYQLDIKPVEVQYLFSGERAIFYFSSEERVDFRELVRELAQHFHVRVDMRQIGARDEAKELGGLAHCGEEFCCTRFGGEFQPVSIRMAKEQDLPLNPAKISGACGRLMCCLRYEYEAYKDFNKRAPKKGTAVDTPLGNAVISGHNTPSETMELKLEDGKRIDVPLAEINCQKDKDGCAHCSVNNETIERCVSRSMLIALGAMEQQLEDALTPGLDEIDIDLAESGRTERKRRRRSAKKTEDTAGASGRAADGKKQAGEAHEGQKSSGTRKRRRRNDNKAASDSAAQGKTTQRNSQRNGANKETGAQSEREEASTIYTNKPRPGQRSSGLRKRRTHAGAEGQDSPKTPQDTSAEHTNSAQKSQRPSTEKRNSKKAPSLPEGDARNTAVSPRTDTRRKRRRHESSNPKGDNGGATNNSSGQSL